MRYAIASLLILVFHLSAWALPTPAPVQVKPGRIASPMSGGVVIGGQSRDEFSLIGARSENFEVVSNDRTSNVRAGSHGIKREGERLILLYGDRFGSPMKGDPGFFHVALDRDSRRVVIDLAQIRKTAVEPAKLARLLSASKIVASSDMTMDPYDGSTNITLNLKVPARLRAASIGGDQSRVVIELQPLGNDLTGEKASANK
jgi:hypothetical protein